MTDTFTFETLSPTETDALAARLGAVVPPGMLILLEGDLGAGKTVFVRGLARGLNIPGDAITSPTYVLQHIHRGGRLNLHHLDAYRLSGGAAEFESSGLLEALADPQAVVCLEWPERLGPFTWPADHILVKIDHLDPQRRRITLQATGPRSAAAVGVLQA